MLVFPVKIKIDTFEITDVLSILLMLRQRLPFFLIGQEIYVLYRKFNVVITSFCFKPEFLSTFDFVAQFWICQKRVYLIIVL